MGGLPESIALRLCSPQTTMPEREARTRRQTVALGAILGTVSSGAVSKDVRRKDVSS